MHRREKPDICGPFYLAGDMVSIHNRYHVRIATDRQNQAWGNAQAENITAPLAVAVVADRMDKARVPARILR